VRPEENGATLYGPITIKELTKRGDRTMHCQDEVGEAGYQIPYNVETIKVREHDAKFIIAIETGGMQDSSSRTVLTRNSTLSLCT